MGTLSAGGFSLGALYVIIAGYELVSTQNLRLGHYGICLRHSRVFCASPLPAGRIVAGWNQGLRFPHGMERQARAFFRPARKSGGAQFLGQLVPALRGRDPGPDPASAA